MVFGSVFTQKVVVSFLVADLFGSVVPFEDVGQQSSEVDFDGCQERVNNGSLLYFLLRVPINNFAICIFRFAYRGKGEEFMGKYL